MMMTRRKKRGKVSSQQLVTQNFQQPPPCTPLNIPGPTTMLMPIPTPSSMLMPMSMRSGGYQPPSTICPPGLEYLFPFNRIFLQRNVGKTEVVPGVHLRNAYRVVDVQGQEIYVIQNESDWLTRVCNRISHGFKMSFYDRDRQVALSVQRPLHFLSDRLNVFNGPKKIGSIKKTVFSHRPEFLIFDENDKQILRIVGPPLMCGSQVEFTVFGENPDGIGIIKKYRSRASHEFFTHANVFGVSFPIDLSVKAKALVLAATILIDSIYSKRKSQ